MTFLDLSGECRETQREEHASWRDEDLVLMALNVILLRSSMTTESSSIVRQGQRCPLWIHDRFRAISFISFEADHALT